jgi:NAD(P)-dependent dehydrogenase (short-subunit alcohol dehydrogenase family)
MLLEGRRAIVTGASSGIGKATAERLGAEGAGVCVNYYSEKESPAADEVVSAVEKAGGRAIAVQADVGKEDDVTRMVERTVTELGGLDLLVNNASLLGPSPQPRLADYPLDVLAHVYEVNTVAPLALAQLALPHLRERFGTIVDITSDAAVEPYEGWGGYGSSKAALEQIGNVLAAEEPLVHVYTFDPGDMRTRMHQEAFPGEDISDRPEPETVVPALLRLLHDRPAGGRYRVTDFSPAPVSGVTS